MKQSILVFLVVLVANMMLQAQISTRFIHPKVISGETNLVHAWSGGINSGQFSEIDLDKDDDMDLFIFDRSSNQVVCFENTGDSYALNEVFASAFPELQHWALLRDYDCDGDNDLFTYSNLGVRVFENVDLNNGIVNFELVIDPLKTQGFSSNINVFFNATDIPIIEDVDGDGDLDFLYFNFANGDFIEFHKNYALENNSCDMELRRVSQQYGQIDVCGCDDFEFNGATCHSNARVLHVTAKAMMAFDNDEDGDHDLVISQEDCNNLSFIENTGSSSVASFDRFTNQFPSFREILDFNTFPATYAIDVTFDGKKDIIISPNDRSSSNRIDFSNTTLLAKGATNSYEMVQPFLQNLMIDLGESAYPVFADLNGDDLLDLIIGHVGSIFFENTISGYSLVNSDLFDLSSLSFTHIRPQVLDINTDGESDLAFTAVDDTNTAALYFILSENKRIDVNNIRNVSLSLESTDQAYFYDYDHDGKLDVLRTNRFGELDFLKNDGSNDDFNLTERIFNILNTTAEVENLGLSIAVGDLNDDQKDDLITTRQSGYMMVYLDVEHNTSDMQKVEIIDSETEQYQPRFGRKSFPSIGVFQNQTVLAIGGIGGGVQLLEIEGVDNGELEVNIFPNPSLDGKVTFETNRLNVRLKIMDIAGKHIKSIRLSEFSTELDLSNLSHGIYVAKHKYNGKAVTRKFVVYSR